MIKNFLNTQAQSLKNSHNGEGPYKLFEIWNKSDFNSNVDFIDRIIIPPKSTIGKHEHGNNEEIYIILEGQATMIIDGKSQPVKKGDMILNTAFSEHGLINNSNTDIDILVIQVSCSD